MSENLLKALMQLFSIITEYDSDETISRSRVLVESFLNQQLNQQLSKKYLSLYNDYIEEKKAALSTKKKKKKTSVNSVKVLVICTKINKELTQRQKIIVLIRLIEFIFTSEVPSEQQQEFIITVSETFNIPRDEFELCKLYVSSKHLSPVPSDKVMVISPNESAIDPSNLHTQIKEFDGLLRIVHIESVNILFVKYFGESELYINGMHIHQNVSYVLNSGGSIRNTKITPIFYSDVIGKFFATNTEDNTTFDVDKITFRFKNGNIGLHPITFSGESGKLVGIMGASGSGKTTLLSLLNGSYKPTTGNILINGINIHEHPEKIKGIVGYVSQDDILIEELTVFQNLYYNTKLSFQGITEEEATNKVNKMLKDLGLYQAKDLKVGNSLSKTISGGQRKRLNIGLELIREPQILFVDEPTSGLSSRDSENIMDLFKELTLKGKLIYIVIHQPSSDIFKMFDTLLLLDTGGFPIYQGNPVEAVSYFKKLVSHANANENECFSCGNVNPEQIFNIIEAKVLNDYGVPTLNRKVTPIEWNEKYEELIGSEVQIEKRDEQEEAVQYKVPSKWLQFKIFITRDVLAKLTNTQYLVINFLESPLLAFILAYLVRYYTLDESNTIGYYFRENENVPAFIFISVIVALFVGLTVSAEEIIRDQKIRKREKFLNLSNGSYLISKIIIMFSISAIQTLTFVLLGNYFLEIKGMNMAYWMVLFSTSCFANMLGLNISSAFNSVVTIYILIPFLLIPQLILSGVIVKFDKLNPAVTTYNSVPLTGNIMTSRWAYEALTVYQFKNNRFERNYYKIDRRIKLAEFQKNFWIPKIREKLNIIINYQNDTSKTKLINESFALLRNEIKKKNEQEPKVQCDQVKNINAKMFSEDVANEVTFYLDGLNKYYLKKYKNYTKAKDKLVSKRNKTKEDRERFIKLRNEYTNDALSDMLKNKNELNKIIQIDSNLYQKANPIYLVSESIDSHFYAPEKRVFKNLVLDTFWFNVIVIWLLSLLLGLMLYFDGFRKTLEGIEKLIDKIMKKPSY